MAATAAVPLIARADSTPQCIRHDVDPDHYKFLTLLTGKAIGGGTFVFRGKRANGIALEASVVETEGANHWVLSSTSTNAHDYKFQFLMRNGELPAYQIGRGGAACSDLQSLPGPLAPSFFDVNAINVFEY